MRPRTFELVRYRDLSGVSGTGVVAEGCVFTDGSVVLRWRGNHPSTAFWPDVESMLAVHGHHGATELRWMQPIPARTSTEVDHLYGDRHTGRSPAAIAEPVPNRDRGWAGARHLR